MIRTARSGGNGAEAIGAGSCAEAISARPCAEAADSPAVRVLCLGNDLLADDGVGPRIARELSGSAPSWLEVVETPESGFALLDYLLGVPRVVVVDAVVTGRAKPGTVYCLEEGEEWPPASSGVSPHYVGLFDALAAARRLELPVAEEVVILAVEADDVATLGAGLCPAVEAALPRLLEEVARIVRY